MLLFTCCFAVCAADCFRTADTSVMSQTAVVHTTARNLRVLNYASLSNSMPIESTFIYSLPWQAAF